jgi:hypothetical protein
MWALQMTMPSIEELSDNEDCKPVSASRYFNKDKTFSKNSSDHANGNGGTNGKALGVSTSSADGSGNSKKSVTQLESRAFSSKSSFAKRPIELLDDDDVIVGAAKVG